MAAVNRIETELLAALASWAAAGDLERRMYTVDHESRGRVLITMTRLPLMTGTDITKTVEGGTLTHALLRAAAWAYDDAEPGR